VGLGDLPGLRPGPPALHVRALIDAWLRADARRVLEVLRDAGAAMVTDAVPVLVAATQRAAQELNQFAAIAPAAARDHAETVARMLGLAAGATDEPDVSAAIEGEAIARRRLLPAGSPIVTCGTYAPLLQLDLLGLEAGALATPVLDVGCGPRALLVAALRQRGIDAHGVDRHVDDDVTHVVRADWEAALPALGSHGTIVSHLALSLHFLHATAAAPGGPEARRLARVWQQLGLALRLGGVLAYVPGLPMLERSLRRPTWEVTRRPLPGDLEAALAPLSARLGEDVAYAARIERRG
jgi:hypothetical protein